MVNTSQRRSLITPSVLMRQISTKKLWPDISLLYPNHATCLANRHWQKLRTCCTRIKNTKKPCRCFSKCNQWPKHLQTKVPVNSERCVVRFICCNMNWHLQNATKYWIQKNLVRNKQARQNTSKQRPCSKHNVTTMPWWNLNRLVKQQRMRAELRRIII